MMNCGTNFLNILYNAPINTIFVRLRFHVCELFIRRTLSVRLLSVSQNRIKRFLMLLFPYVRISVRKNKRTDKVRMWIRFPIFSARKLRENHYLNSHDFTRGIIIKIRFKTETYEKLIGLVGKEPALYDASLSGYKDYTLQKHLWQK